jgi:hypothetical protein
VIKYIVSSHSALRNIQDPLFKRIVNPTIGLKSFTSIRYTVLPELMDKLRNEISLRLEQAIAIVFVPDGWTNFKMAEYQGTF